MRTVNMRAITRLATLEQFESLACEWEALLGAAQIENIFLTHVWLREWWRLYCTGRELWILVARGPTGIEGIAPLVLEHAQGGTRRLVFMGANEIQPDHLDLIIRPEMRADLTREFWSYLWQVRTEWDILDLNGLPAESPTRELLVDQMLAHGLTAQIAVSSHSPYVVLPDSFEEYLQSSGHETRKQLRRKQRRLALDFPTARFGRVETEAELETVFDALVGLHQVRWTGRGYQGAFATATFTAFHRAMAREALAHDSLRLYFLQIDGTLVATQYYCRAGSRVFSYSYGFDERWSKYSVGILLMAYVIEQSIAEGVREVDFLQGEEAYKAHWSTGVRESWRVRAASPHLRGQLAWMRMQAADQLITWAVKHVPRTTRSKVRHLLRLT